MAKLALLDIIFPYCLMKKYHTTTIKQTSGFGYILVTFPSHKENNVSASHESLKLV